MTKVLTSTEIEDFINRLMFDDSLTILSARGKPINNNQLKYTIIIEDRRNVPTKDTETKKRKPSKKEKDPKKEKVIISPNRDPIPPPRPPMAEITQL